MHEQGAFGGFACQSATNVGPPFTSNVSPLTQSFAVARRRSAEPLRSAARMDVQRFEADQMPSAFAQRVGAHYGDDAYDLAGHNAGIRGMADRMLSWTFADIQRELTASPDARRDGDNAPSLHRQTAPGRRSRREPS
jgi:hypothetical protein